MLILFDIDGTLLHGSGCGRSATRAALIEVFGTPTGIDQHKFGGKTDWQTLIELLEVEGIDRATIAERLPAFEQSLARHMADAVRVFDVHPLPGALEAVQRVRQRDDLLTGIVTGNMRATAPIKLRAAGFDPEWFAVGAYGNEAIDRNDLPPLALERAMRHSGRAYTPDEVWIIGDTVADVACARALGARCIAVTTGFSTRAELASCEPDYLIDSLDALDGLF